LPAAGRLPQPLYLLPRLLPGDGLGEGRSVLRGEGSKEGKLARGRSDRGELFSHVRFEPF
jgi:hypothetical protein